MAGARGQPSARESQLAGGNTRGAQSQERAQSPGREGNPGEENSTPGSPSGRGQEQRPSSANRGGSDAEQASAGNPPDGQEPGQGQGQNQARGGNARQGGRRGGNQQSNGGPRGGQRGGGNAAGDNPLRNLAVQLGRGGEPGGPITGNNYVNWSDRLRDVEQVLDPADLRNQVATVRERASVLRSDYRLRGQRPPAEVVREQILTPLSQIRVWVQEELARKEKSDSLVPLDRDPVPENYAEMVRKYYEKLGSAQ